MNGPTYREFLESLDPERRRSWLAWLRERPLEVRELATRNPPGCSTEFGGRTVFVVGYAPGTLGPGYMLTPADPAVDIEAAVAGRFFACAGCVHGTCAEGAGR